MTTSTKHAMSDKTWERKQSPCDRMHKRSIYLPVCAENYSH